MLLQILIIVLFLSLFVLAFIRPDKKKRRRRSGQRGNSSFIGGHSAYTGTDCNSDGGSFDSGGSCDSGGYDGGGGCDGGF